MCGPDHGLDLEVSPRSRVSIFAAYASDESTVETEVFDHLSRFFGDSHSLDYEVEFLRKDHLGSAKGFHTKATRDHKGVTTVNEAYVAYSKNGSILYVVEVESTTQEWASIEAAYRALVASWQDSAVD
ncbi:MAG: hypothetical protein LBQ20_10290 [Rhodanobacter sp.]|nr:hypothetical protein [Rhodanobacter sp.]